MIMVMVVMVMVKYIMGVLILCWIRSLVCILRKTDFSVGDNRPSSCPVYTVY